MMETRVTMRLNTIMFSVWKWIWKKAGRNFRFSMIDLASDDIESICKPHKITVVCNNEKMDFMDFIINVNEEMYWN